MITSNRVWTLIISAAGVGLFWIMHWPLPFLLGPMAACLVGALVSAPLQGMGVVGVIMRTFLGVAIGTSVTPDILGRLPGFAMSLSMVPVLVLAIALAGFRLMRAMGFDRQTSLYASLPGGLQEMLFLGDDAGGNVRAMSLIHATRVLALFCVVPLAITFIWEIDLSNPPGMPASTVPPLETAIIVASGIAGWRLAELLRIPGPSLLGPALLTMTLTLAGVLNHRPPTEILVASQFFIGLTVGVRYAGITLVELRKYVLAGVIYVLIAGAISLTLFFVISRLLDLPPINVLLAYLPGGQVEMAIIAIIAGADLPFIIAHHFFRIVVVLFLAQLLSKWLKRH